jgi:hypothetical protein
MKSKSHILAKRTQLAKDFLTAGMKHFLSNMILVATGLLKTKREPTDPFNLNPSRNLAKTVKLALISTKKCSTI